MILFMFVSNFDIVAELESGTHITPSVQEIPGFAKASLITICDGSGLPRRFLVVHKSHHL